MDKTIIVSGKGGEGIKFMGTVFGKLMIKLGYEVAITFNYDAAMRGGDITAYITVSEKSVDNPLPEDADITIKIKDTTFVNTAIKLGDKKLTGMIVLGYLLKQLNLTDDKVMEVLPENNKEKNLEAIKKGYSQ